MKHPSHDTIFAFFPVIAGLGLMTILSTILFYLEGEPGFVNRAALPYAILGAAIGTLHGMLWARSSKTQPLSLKTWLTIGLSTALLTACAALLVNVLFAVPYALEGARC